MRSSTAVLIKGFTIVPSQGSKTEAGVWFTFNCYNCSIMDNIITNFTDAISGSGNAKVGIRLSSSSNNIIVDNDITGNEDFGIYLGTYNSIGSHNNTVYGNNITNSIYGVYCYESVNNEFYHNNFIDNSNQAYDRIPSSNDWYHSTLLEGNYWSDYAGVDNGSGVGKHAVAGDGIGDTFIPHPDADYDFYPLMNPWTPSTLADFEISASPTSQSIYPGQSTIYTVNITSINGFNSSVSLSLSGLPINASYTFGPEPVTPPSDGSVQSTLQIFTESAVSPGTYHITLTGSSNEKTHSTSVTLVILSENFCFLTIISSPISGISLTVNGTEHTTPYADSYAYETALPISAPSSVSIYGRLYFLDQWTDDQGFSSASNSVTYAVPKTSSATLTAHYLEDSIPPTITHTPVTTGNEEQPISITATITDNVAVTEATLYYRKTTETVYTLTTMTNIGDTYTGTIPASAVTMIGLQYYINATDGTNIATDPATNPTTSPHTIIVHDTTPPTVSVTINPTDPDTTQTVVFNVTVGDAGGSGIANITLYIDDIPVKIWTSAGTYTYTGGPYAEGTHTCYAIACDLAGNDCRDPSSGYETFTVSAPPQPLPLWQLLIAAVVLISVGIAISFAVRRKK